MARVTATLLHSASPVCACVTLVSMFSSWTMTSVASWEHSTSSSPRPSSVTPSPSGSLPSSWLLWSCWSSTDSPISDLNQLCQFEITFQILHQSLDKVWEVSPIFIYWTFSNAECSFYLAVFRFTNFIKVNAPTSQVKENIQISKTRFGFQSLITKPKLTTKVQYINLDVNWVH